MIVCIAEVGLVQQSDVCNSAPAEVGRRSGNPQTRFRQQPLENAAALCRTDGSIHALCKASVLRKHAQVPTLDKKQQLDRQHCHDSHQHNKQLNKEGIKDHANEYRTEGTMKEHDNL